ncbi:PcfJ domain-containing protein [uncultured Bacteroides sp.]|uniref:PcfJ domain-containing protein n=1 Tax=uncultured Bacteroides sp. TaxID=162156 RepID=UPI002AA94600|nr:PcfJ domain-containing protein [uncultured Bacteroides sp.]
MKPRTKLQHQVLDYSQHLWKIDKEMLEWAKVDCLEHKGYATKTRVLCMDCGQRFSTGLVKRKHAVCPHCGTRLEIEQSRKRTDKQHMYIAKAEICGEFQVIRNFELYAYYEDEGVPRYFIHEVLQHWIKDANTREVVALGHVMGNVGWSGGLEIRKKTVGGYYNYSNDICPEKYHPKSIFKDEYMRYGIDHKLQGLSFLRAINILLSNNKAETLLKARKYDLLSYCNGSSYKIEAYWSSIKICLRNNYNIKDLSIWFDYLELLSRYHKDLRNAHYVCPKNLKKAHDLYVAKKKKDDEKAYREREKKRMLMLKNAAENYIKEKSKFFDLNISDGKITVVPLKSIEEFKEEGEEMHHCVYSNEYFLNENALILSARIDDKRIETVEVNLKTLHIVQSRGVCNKSTEYHDRIVGLVKKNIGVIRQRMTVQY